MMLLSILAAVALTWGLGRLLVRFLGWPTGVDAAMRWAIALVVVGVVYAGLPDLWRLCDPVLRARGWDRVATPNLPRVGLLEVLGGCCFVGLAVLGYVGWMRAPGGRDAAARLEDQVRHQARRPARPPAPEDGDDGFHHVG